MKYVLGENIKVEIATSNEMEIIMKFQDEVLKSMNNKEFFKPLTIQEFEEAICNGYIYLLYYEVDLCGLCVLNCMPSQEVLREYMLYDTKGVGILDSVMIKEKYRGSGLQKQILKYVEKDVNKYNLRSIIATIHPQNVWSLNNFLACDYLIINKVIIHGGERYIVSKKYN